jgi:hypothetical protein
MLLFPGATSGVASVYLAANAVPLLVPPAEGLSLVRDRGFPESARLVSPLDPLALRLVLGDPKAPPPPALDPATILDPDLERVLREWLAPVVARLAGELRGADR